MLLPRPPSRDSVEREEMDASQSAFVPVLLAPVAPQPQIAIQNRLSASARPFSKASTSSKAPRARRFLTGASEHFFSGSSALKLSTAPHAARLIRNAEIRAEAPEGAAVSAPARTGTGASSSPIWTPDSWRTKPIKQHPTYGDKASLEEVESKLRNSPPLVFTGEVRRLQDLLARASAGKAFLLQGGDCAESFTEFHPDNIRDTFQVLIQMTMVLMYGLRVPIIKVGRMAGQFAKPRSSDMEKRGDMELPSYRGDMINGPEFTSEARIPNPDRMLQCYQQSTATLNMLRALAQGGYVDLRRVHEFSLDFVRSAPQAQRYGDVADRIDGALAFMEACGIDSDNPQFRQAEYFVSHEALLLNYEEALVRQDKQTGEYFATSGHFLWIGDRTRQPEGAHIEFMRGISNPIGIKVGPSMDPDELLRLLDILNPDDIPGRITIITRNGAHLVDEKLPPIMRAIARSGRTVTWSCDPMHGNTITSKTGFKTRRFDAVLSEVRSFFEIAKSEGVIPGGIHLEMTGQNVTECTGGASQVTEETLADCYVTACDPRMNASQALELAFLIAEQASGRCSLPLN
eukprot:tig00000863_g4976.t1